MGMPNDVRAIDLMLNVPGEDQSGWYEFMKPLLLDADSRNFVKMPAEYLFTTIPDVAKQDDYVAYTVAEMDKWGIGKAMLSIADDKPTTIEAIRRFPDRFFPSMHVNPNNAMDEVRTIERYAKEYGIKALTAFPAGTLPQVPINDKKFYPIYAKAVELDLPICVTVGVPGPRLPMAPQHVELIDEVCWFFPELKFVMRHGAEPWVDLAVKLMIKYPNLYYSTSAFAPRHYPKAIIDYANTRGADKILYAGYFPMGLSLERIMTDMPKVPFKDDVWPKFLRDNAVRVFKL
jgi:uncharacterized protein